MAVDLSDEEIKILIEILKFAQDSCPIEAISSEIDISSDAVASLTAKLEGALEAK